MAFLEVKNLYKKFKIHTQGGVEIDGFKDINFSLKKGEFLSLLGPSGAGKSSVLKALNRTYLSSGGEILLQIKDDKQIDLAKLSDSEILEVRKKYIGYVSQFLQVLPRIGAVDIVSAPLIQQGESQKAAKQKAKELLSYLSIKEELFELSPLTFSGGEQQRVNIARGIIAPKPLILLDEPTASLDKTNRLKVVEKLKELKKNGISMVGIFHDKDTMELIADKTYEIGASK
ncbi:phosphonate C-P lyase system protein PhnL [Campylobacter suis]|uniref:Alpha-D-ribose 1-methylphosphonate 5-triphosphate synthase subunit PhnL n=1 Tax=Campylobacter suis TaxID=2790657 RepID=A0ABM8Q932_9BACT|nr:phosphonate C-P lyase system protein PhnL [Campylobacter suis]CAD7289336.1 Alpha-D-ribose 1-methylphosphonate 5-triphosphate synthase subunit PhnL [Campylobacter suis]